MKIASLVRRRALTTRQVAAMLSVHTATIKRYERQGMLPAMHLSPRTTRYLESDVYALMDQMRVRPVRAKVSPAATAQVTSTLVTKPAAKEEGS